MFARLKEKIQKEGGNVSDGDRPPTALPGHASPRRLSYNTVTGTPGKDKGGADTDSEYGGPSSPNTSVTSEDPVAKGEYGSKDEIFVALQKKTDQCRKFEAKISEYAAVIKDKTKTIEKLEGFIEKHQDDASRKSQELNEQYHAQRSTLLDRHKEELAKKEKEKQDLEEKLKATESLRDQFSKKEAEIEERQSSASQELVRVQTLLLSTQTELAEKMDKCETADKQVKDLTNQVSSLKQTVNGLQAERDKLEEGSRGHISLVSSLTKEKLMFEQRVDELNTQLSEKSSALSSLQSKLGELEDSKQAWTRNSEQQKNKLNQLVQEKTDHIEQLQDRIHTLEQRGMDQSLSGDERVQALEKERDNMERKLTEAREQLSQIKSSWSEKISHLEEQISHLNTKIVEDNEELAHTQKSAETVRENLHKEIEALKEKVNDAEKRALENWELAKNKDIHYDREKRELETTLSKIKDDKMDLETQLRAKITSLESQILSSETAKTHEKSLLIEKITHYKTLEKESIEKEIKAERRIEELEQMNSTLQNEVYEKQNSCEGLQKDLQEKSSQMSKLQEDLNLMKEKLESLQEKLKSKSSELFESDKEKDGLMLRNAELSQQVTSLQRSVQDDRQMHEMELKARDDTENSLRQQCDQLQESVAHYEQRLEEAAVRETDRQSESMQVLQQTVRDLEEQMADKNRALKKQDQRLTDLKKTLQRELKVQSLPNDEMLDPKVATLTPPPQRKHSGSRNSVSPDVTHIAKQRGQSSVERLQGHSAGDSKPGAGLHETGSVLDGRKDGPSLYDRGQISYDKFLPHKPDSHAAPGLFHTNSGHGKVPSDRNWDTRHLEKDVNFQYLKHVVMKFMLSREHEAVQLLKAVSLLLRLSAEEQQLMKDTLEWKMSWFGGSQPPALLRGQSSKIIPPSY